MSRWTASRLAWSLWLLAMALVVLSVLLGVRNAATVAAFVDDTLVFVPMVVSFATVGALVAARHPRNPIGWLFASFAAIVGLVLVAQGYATYALVTAPGRSQGATGLPGSAPGRSRSPSAFPPSSSCYFPTGICSHPAGGRSPG